MIYVSRRLLHHLFAADFRLCGCEIWGLPQRCRHAGNLAGIRRVEGDAPRSMTVVMPDGVYHAC